ncbi:glycoside hydrolase family 88 protein [Ferruginibacter yonginensis]|uniref:Glycoside hydrolase family 88 protein n=1 Tax=Ferruginibacter yonginensis TaxID=1310416 RepID=A0ABV8QMC6_9BACT
MKKYSIIFFICISFNATTSAQMQYSKAVTATAMNIWKDSFALDGKPAKWAYDQGVILEGVVAVWKATADVQYFNYIQKSMDNFLNEDGTIKTYKQTDFNIDNVKNGRALLFLYRVTGKEKYWKAATILRNQLRNQPRNATGGFWHKQVYPNQMWLDGLYMAEPFYTEYAMLAHEDTAFNDIAQQFILMNQFGLDAKTGLLYHAYDASKEMGWANKVTGQSPNFWARSIGWYVMALVDVLENFPVNHPKRNELVNILNSSLQAVVKYQDKKSGCWYDIIDQPTTKGNYLEASASSMFIYAMAKGARLKLLPNTYQSLAQKAYKGLVKQFIQNNNNQTDLAGTVKVSGLGGKPYRDGSVAYYLGEPVIVNDPKGMGAFIQAAAEVEMIPTLQIGKNKSVLLDYYFNHETQKDITGTTVQFHYIWEQMDNGGYSMLGHVFNKYGVATKKQMTAVTADDLKNTSIYFIIDPDWPKENKNPHYIEPAQIDVIYNWVKAGGVLMLFANDSNNVEFKHYNELANKFGIHFNENYRNMVKGNEYETGTFNILPNNLIFKTAKKLYLKEICTINVKAPAKAVLSDNSDVIMAVAKVGKGTVFAVGDPWLYNEYIDGRKIPSYLENYKGAEDLVQWLIKQTKK